MRLPNLSVSDSITNTIRRLDLQRYKLDQQISSGQKITLPEDDGMRLGRVINLDTEKSKLAQYQRNASYASEFLNAGHLNLDNLRELNQRAQEISRVAGSSLNGPAMETYGNEINQLIEQSVQIANTNNQFGYIFSGTKSNAETYGITRNENGEISEVEYQGSTDTLGIEIAKGSQISVEIPGSNTTESGTQGLFETREGSFFTNLIELRDRLDSGTREDVAYIRETVTTNLMKDESNVIYHISRVGALEARLETAKTLGTRRITAANEFVSKEVDADLAKTLVKLNEIQTAYLAALKSGSTIMNQSLLDYV